MAEVRPYNVQVATGEQSTVRGRVQPEAVSAVKVRRRPRTTLYFNPDITTPFVGEFLRPRSVIVREYNAECHGIQ